MDVPLMFTNGIHGIKTLSKHPPPPDMTPS